MRSRNKWTKIPAIHPIILDALNLKENERFVFEVIRNQVLASSVSDIAQKAGVPRSTVNRVVVNLQRRKLIIRVGCGRRFRWRYRKNIERLRLRPKETI